MQFQAGRKDKTTPEIRTPVEHERIIIDILYVYYFFSANQMWCLGLHLPLLIGDLVPENDNHWELLCILLQSVRIIFSPVVTMGQITYLQVLIQRLLENFKALFPGSSIIPKMHYMVHMPRTIYE